MVTILNECCKEDRTTALETSRRTLDRIADIPRVGGMYSDDEEYQEIIHDLRNVHVECRTCGRKEHTYDTCDVLVNHIMATDFVQKNPEVKDVVRKDIKTFVRKLASARQQFLREHSTDNSKQTKFGKSMVQNIVSNLEVMISKLPKSTTKEAVQNDQPKLINGHTSYGNINRVTDSLKYHTRYDSSVFSPVCIYIKKRSIDTVYKHDLVNKISESWLADLFQYTSFLTGVEKNPYHLVGKG